MTYGQDVASIVILQCLAAEIILWRLECSRGGYPGTARGLYSFVAIMVNCVRLAGVEVAAITAMMTPGKESTYQSVFTRLVRSVPMEGICDP